MIKSEGLDFALESEDAEIPWDIYYLVSFHRDGHKDNVRGSIYSNLISQYPLWVLIRTRFLLLEFNGHDW